MKKYAINGRTVTVRKGSFAHRVLDSKYIIPLLWFTGVVGASVAMYALVVGWACVLG